MCGYGKVSAAVQMPILSYMGLDVFNLPTMLISNTFPYGKYAIWNALRISRKPCRSGTNWAFTSMPSPRVSWLRSVRLSWWHVIAENRQHWAPTSMWIP